DIKYSGVEGVYAKEKVLSLTLENNVIDWILDSAIYMVWSGANNCVIRGNTISHTCLFPGLCQSGDSRGQGIMVWGNDCLIEKNTLIDTGYHGITFNGSRVNIRNNYIDGCCLTKDDGGGIYTDVYPHS